jgi:RNA polymerase sigma-B factor
VTQSPHSPRIRLATSRGQHDRDHAFPPDHCSSGRPAQRGVTMIADTDLAAPTPTKPTANKRHKEPTALTECPPASWRPRRPASSAPRKYSDATQQALGDTLLTTLGRLATSDPDRVTLRAKAIDWYLPMATHLARRFRGRGEPLTDLTQTAAIGLIKAIDRYDPHRGVPFASYAIPTILGEIKRHFRDNAQTIHVPRALQELRPQLVAATDDLTHTLHRAPTTAELATRLAISQREVTDTRRSANAYHPLSLDQPIHTGQDPTLIDAIGVTDPAIAAADTNEMLRVRLAKLPHREQRIINLRYFSDLTQNQIAAEIGVSQMHISRLLARSLAQLRTDIRADPDAR